MKTDKIVELSKQKSASRQEQVLKTIYDMKKKDIKISFYSVGKRTGASKSYLYGNKTIREEIINDRNEKPEKIENTGTTIRILKLKIKKLESENKKLRENFSESYEEKYNKILIENNELKKQLKAAYKY